MAFNVLHALDVSLLPYTTLHSEDLFSILNVKKIKVGFFKLKAFHYKAFRPQAPIFKTPRENRCDTPCIIKEMSFLFIPFSSRTRLRAHPRTVHARVQTHAHFFVHTSRRAIVIFALLFYYRIQLTFDKGQGHDPKSRQ